MCCYSSDLTWRVPSWPSWECVGRGSVQSQLSPHLHFRASPEMTGQHRLPELLSRIKDQGPRIKDQGSRIKDQGSRIKDQGSRIKDQGTRIKDQGSRIKGQGLLLWTLLPPEAAIAAYGPILLSADIILSTLGFYLSLGSDQICRWALIGFVPALRLYLSVACSSIWSPCCLHNWPNNCSR